MAPEPIIAPANGFVANTFPDNPTDFQHDLLTWYRAHRRKLPWRESPSLYRTVVSEFMLQQTQIKTALPYFERWMTNLPDFASLAAAEESTVLKLWEGLGYYSRARNLHKMAKAFLEMPSQDPRGMAETPGDWLLCLRRDRIYRPKPSRCLCRWECGAHPFAAHRQR